MKHLTNLLLFIEYIDIILNKEVKHERKESKTKESFVIGYLEE